MTDNIVPAHVCPTCGANNDRATAVDGTDATPRPGDITICEGCGMILIFQDTEGNVEVASVDHLREFQRNAPDEWKLADMVSRGLRRRYLKGKAE